MFEPCYFSILPAKVRYDDSLSSSEKLLFSEISSLCNKNGYCFANNEYFAKLYKTHKNTISRWISHLKIKKYIRVFFTYKEKTKAIDKRMIAVGPEAFVPEENNLLIEDTSIENIDEKIDYPISKNVNTPISKNVKDNNIKFNNSIDRNIYTDFEKKFNKPITPITKSLLDQFLLVYSEDIINHAFDIAIENHIPKISYVSGILKNWKNSNYETLEDITRTTQPIPDFTDEELQELEEILNFDWFEEGG